MDVDKVQRTESRGSSGIDELFLEYPSTLWTAYMVGAAVGIALLGMVLGQLAGFFPDWSITIYILAGMLGVVALMVGALGAVLGVISLAAIYR